MDSDNLIEIRNVLYKDFGFKHSLSVDQVEKLYDVFYSTVSKNDKLQKYIYEKQQTFKLLRKNNKSLATFLSLVNALAQINNIRTPMDIYDIEVLIELVGLVLLGNSDNSYRKYDSLLSYILDLLESISCGYLKNEDWNSLLKIAKRSGYCIKIEQSQFKAIYENFHNQKNELKKRFSLLFDYYTYDKNIVIVKQKLTNGRESLSGLSISLFALPLKALANDLVKHIDTIENSNLAYQEKIEKFIKEHALSSQAEQIFRERCKNPNITTDQLCKTFNISSSYLDDCVNEFMPALRVAAGYKENDRTRFKKAFKSFINQDN